MHVLERYVMDSILPAVSHDASSIGPTRRAILKFAWAMGLSWHGVVSTGARRALAAPLVKVNPPTIVHTGPCTKTVSVKVIIAGSNPGDRYDVSGDILEADEPDGEADVCVALLPQSIISGDRGFVSFILEGHANAADLGLVKGLGPASDEAFSPDLVELFARIWLRDLATDESYGPWDSPRRVAVASDGRAWEAGRLPGSEFMTAGGRGLTRANDPAGMLLPPRTCAK
jgi:hypothetical protein